MKFGLFSDPHITRKIQEFPAEWEKSVIDSFNLMYSIFIKEKVDFVICAGDFFDKAIIEARSVPLVNKVKDIMSGIKTYLLLGNHEIDSNDHNILDAYDYYENFIPVTKLTTLSDNSKILFIPYNVDLSTLDKGSFKDKIIITHHDIYGSVLAGGKLKASFGYDPNMFNDSEIVFNGHIHLRSVLGKVHNVGSLLTSQFGELREDSYDFPRYYIYDTDTKVLTDYMNDKSLYYLTVNSQDLYKLNTNDYNNLNIMLRVNYKDEKDVEELELPDNVLKVTKRKLISNSVDNSTEIVRSSNIDIKSIITSYVSKDQTVLEEDKSRIISKCFEVLGG